MICVRYNIGRRVQPSIYAESVRTCAGRLEPSTTTTTIFLFPQQTPNYAHAARQRTARARPTKNTCRSASPAFADDYRAKRDAQLRTSRRRPFREY